MRSEEVNLAPFTGAECTLIKLGPYNINLIFDGVGVVSMKCPYELRSASGQLLEARDASKNEKDGSRLGALLAVKVASFAFSEPAGLSRVSDRFVLGFENGLTLAVIESTDSVESAIIHYERAQPKIQVI